MVRDIDPSRRDEDTIARAILLSKLMDAAIRDAPPQERDRRMQVHLAQARGPAANAKLLAAGIRLMLRMKEMRRSSETDND